MTDAASETVRPEEIHILLEHFSKNSYKVKGDSIKGEPVIEKCLKLFAKDYQYSIINNSSGDLCGTYPSKIVLLEYEKDQTCTDIEESVESLYDATKVRELFKQARFARCRSRFAVPVIFYKGKHVCRSATLSSGAEMYSRSGLDFFMGGEQNGPAGMKRVASSDGDMQMFDRVRGQDIHVLKTFNVNCICDLMVEKKKVKFGMNVTSSEKVDKENRYGEFVIVSMPYPGCEFFKKWKENSYFGEIMKFDWNQSFVDACLDIPPTEVLSRLQTDWSSYQYWNIIQLTQNYLKMLIHILHEGDKGILVHCISGWDRTPMFVSLLRLSLWADGAIHASLSAVEVLYLTLAYDWYLFGHCLSDRLNKGEEILLFCFYFLSYITSDEYSVIPKTKKCSSTSRLCQNGSDSSPSATHTSDGCAHSSRVGRSSDSGSVNIDTGQAAFYVCSDDDGQSSSVPQRMCNSNGGCSLHDVQSSTSSNRRSSPVDVPSLHKPMSSDNLESPCGSWQVLSSSGNILTTDSCTNPKDPCSSKSEPHCSRRMSSCEEAIEGSVSTQRWTRLDSVRRIFHNAYHNTITRKYKPETGITNLFDQFAEKVGIRQNKSFH